ncbi:MAG: periplasmic heavy metal sensor [Caulobacteraceae bacterium]
MNGAFWRNLAITVVLAAAAAYAGARIAEPPAKPAEAARAKLLLRDSVYQMVHQDMTLTDDQKRKIDEIEARFAHRRNELRTQIGSANAELGEALANEMALGTAASRALEHLQQSMGDLQRETILYTLEVRATLTPKQQQVLDQKVFESLTAGPF